MSNIFGPDVNKGGSTIRPERTTPNSLQELWFKNCTDPGDTDNTVITADFLNFLIANLRNAARGLSIPEVEDDDDLILKMFQNNQSEIDSSNVPIFPEVPNGGLITTATSNGQVEVLPGQSIIHRGLNLYLTSNYSLEDRQFLTTASETYHLRWSPLNGFQLKNLTDGTYNPTSASEDDPIFDTKYDDMLVAKVITDSSNSPTVLSLINKVKLFFWGEDEATTIPFTEASNHAIYKIVPFPINWSRTPTPMVTGYVGHTGPSAIAAYANRPKPESFNRYEVVGSARSVYDSPNLGYLYGTVYVAAFA